MLTEQDLEQIASVYNVDAIFGNYPYAAWYNQRAWLGKEWEGYWFGREIHTDTLYCPTNEKDTHKLYGYFHEIGHILNLRDGEHSTIWYNEIEAWTRSIRLMKVHCKTVDHKEFSLHAISDCLYTYIPREQRRSGRARVTLLKEAHAIITKALSEIDNDVRS